MKAIFLDYTGTMVKQDGPEFKEMVKFFLTNSTISSPQEALGWVWSLVKKYELESYLDSFKTEEEIVATIIQDSVQKYSLHGDLAYLEDLWHRSWIHAPLFEDVKPFFDACSLPIYVITNDGQQYIQASMDEKQLKPAGIISAESVRAYKPHPEIFQEALRVAGVQKEEVYHVGDSIASDVKGALAAGIQPVYIDRKEKATCPEAIVISSLLELKQYL